MTDHDPNNLGDMAAAYAIGALDADEIKAFEALMAQSAEARRAVDEYREVGALLAHGAPPAQPSPDLRKRLMARVQAEKARSGANGKRTMATSQWLAWAAAAAGLIVGSVQTVRLLDLGDRLAGVESQAQTLARELQERQAMLDQILEPQTMLIVLTATDARPPGMRIFWNRAANTVLINAFALSPVAAGRAYQLWFLDADGNPIPSSTFNADSSGNYVATLPGPPANVTFAAAAVTEEPASGSPQPTTTPILFGRVADQ